MRRTPSISTSGPAGGALVLALAASACGVQQQPAPAPPHTADPQAAREIETMLRASARSWTRGDLEGYLDDYASDATFVGSSGLSRGVERIRENYMAGYWSAGMPEDGLRFRLLEVRTIGPITAVAVGRYILFDRSTDEATATGLFSLTLRRTDAGWKIVHDHSSADGSG